MRFLHNLPLAAASQSVSLSLVTDFAVACGINQAGEPVLGSASSLQYIVAGGIPGMLYGDELGAAGGRIDFTFPVPVTALVVATYSGVQPVPVLAFVPYVPPVDQPAVVLISSIEADDSYHDDTTKTIIVNFSNGGNALVRFAERRPKSDLLRQVSDAMPVGSEWKGTDNYPGFNIS